MDRMDPVAAANRLLRNQLRDVASQLLTLTERLYLLTQEFERTDRLPRDTGHDAFRGIPPVRFATFDEATNAALRAEQELAEARSRQGYPGIYQGRTYAYPGPAEDSLQRGRAAKRPRTEQNVGQAIKRGPEPQWKPCVICDGAHRLMSCPWRDDHCFKCGKPGHSRFSCPQKPATPTPAPLPGKPEKAAAPVLQEGPNPRTRANQRPKRVQEDGQVPTGGPKPLQEPCVICGKAHLVTRCLWEYSHCNRCGQPDHTRASCPQEPVATTATPQPGGREDTAAPAPQENLPGGQHPADSYDTKSLSNHAVRRWPEGCGRTPRTTTVEDAMSQNK